MSPSYAFTLPAPTRTALTTLRVSLTAGESQPGERLQAVLAGAVPDSDAALFGALLGTRVPRIFAESDVRGDGSDWTRAELAVLGDVGCVMDVHVFDDGRHRDPEVFTEPFPASLLFVCGALLAGPPGVVPVDLPEVTRAGALDPEAYHALYRRRLLPLLCWAGRRAADVGRRALVTVPGIGCGQFAGPFRGRLGPLLETVLARILEEEVASLGAITAIHFDPYDECVEARREIRGRTLLTRPLLSCAAPRPQLCRPEAYEQEPDEFGDHMLFSVVAWDHVSWPGNDWWAGSRATDDGVKAAATDAMSRITGHRGRYDPSVPGYAPPVGFSTWAELASREGVGLDAARAD